MSRKYLHADATTWLDSGDLDQWETEFDSVSRNFVIGPLALTVESPENHRFCCEAMPHEGTARYWQGGVKKETVNYTSRDGTTGSCLNIVPTVTEIDFEGNIVQTVEMRPTEPSITPTDATSTVTAAMKFRNATVFSMPSVRPNTLTLGTFTEEGSSTQAVTPRGSVGDSLNQVGLPPWAFIGDAQGSLHGFIMEGNWIISQIANANSWQAYNVVTGESYEERGWEGVPSTAVAYSSLDHSQGNYPWDVVGDDFAGFANFTQDMFNVMGPGREGTVLIHRERHYFTPQFVSNFDHQYDWSYSTASWLNPQNPGSAGASNGTASATAFGSKWIHGFNGTYGNVTVTDDLNIGESSFGIGVPTDINAGSITNCGQLPCNPTRSTGNNTSTVENPPPDPISSLAEQTAENAIGVLFEQLRDDLDEALGKSRYLGTVCYLAEHWIEEREVGTWNLVARKDFNSATTNPEDGAAVYRGQSIVNYLEGSTLAEMDVEEYPEEAGYTGRFFRLRQIELGGYKTHSPGALPFDSGTGEFLHYVTGAATFSDDGMTRDITETGVGPGERNPFQPYSADGGNCGPPNSPEGPYLKLNEDEEPGDNLARYQDAFYWQAGRIYAPESAEGAITYQFPAAGHTCKYAHDRTIWVELPRARTGAGGNLPHVGSDPEDAAFHDEECERLHQIRAWGYSAQTQKYDQLLWETSTQSIVGVGPNNAGDSRSNPNHGDCVSNGLITAGYLHCLLSGSDGVFWCHLSLRETGAYAAGEVVTKFEVATDTFDVGEEIQRDGIILKRATPAGLGTVGHWTLEIVT